MTETRWMKVGPDPGAGANLMPLLRTRRVLRVGSARAGSVARLPRRPLVMGSLKEAFDLTLGRVHVIQSVVGADRVGVFGCPGAVTRTGKRITWSAWRALYLTSEGGTCTCTRKGDCARRSRKEGLRVHVLPLSEHRSVARTEATKARLCCVKGNALV